MADTSHLDLLHDHHKDSFAYIVEREKERERLLLILIALFALLALEIGYPVRVEGALGTASIFGVGVNIDALPLPAFLTATWVLVLAMTLRYCRASINIERQYKYLHTLEKEISAHLGSNIYRREGDAYEDNYPLFSWSAWRFYTVMLPIVAALAVFALYYQEWEGLTYSWLYKVSDLVVAVGVAWCFISYRTIPQIEFLIKAVRGRKGSKDSDDTPT